MREITRGWPRGRDGTSPACPASSITERARGVDGSLPMASAPCLSRWHLLCMCARSPGTAEHTEGGDGEDRTEQGRADQAHERRRDAARSDPCRPAPRQHGPAGRVGPPGEELAGPGPGAAAARGRDARRAGYPARRPAPLRRTRARRRDPPARLIYVAAPARWARSTAIQRTWDRDVGCSPTSAVPRITRAAPAAGAPDPRENSGADGRPAARRWDGPPS